MELTAAVMYGHIHIAKTGGTTLNEMLANKYENGCGNKGYSYDFFGANQRSKEFDDKPGQVNDSFHHLYPKLDRQNVPPELMNEIGFEDCYWVSFEGSFGWWKRFEKWYEPVELHLPCRDPIEHLMSQMNYRNKKMNCTSFQIEEVHKHFVFLDYRFSSKNIPKNMTLKCIHFDDQFGPYIESLGLTPKRYQQPLHVHHTNKDRNREKECIWRHDRLREKLRLYMIQNIDYYKFCDECNSWFPTRNDTR